MLGETEQQENLKIGVMLQVARKYHHVTQQDIANAAGLTQNQVSKIERGTSKAPVSVLLAYCKRLNSTPNDILGFSEAEPPSELQRLIDSMTEEEQDIFYKIGKLLKGRLRES